MTQERYSNIESVLVADCGSNTTRVVLVEVVEQAYRFVARGEAPSTLEEPYNDVTVGVLNAIATIEANTGRTLLLGGRLLVPQQEDGSGVDAFVACSSAAEPLRVVVSGVVRNLAADSANRASHSTYTTVLATIGVDDTEEDVPDFDYDPDDLENEASPFIPAKSKDSHNTTPARKPEAQKKSRKKQQRGWKQRQVARLRRLNPNVLVVAGGVDGAPTAALLELMDVVLEANRQEMMLAGTTGENRRPLTLLYAGNPEGREPLIQKTQGQIELFMLDPLRPSVERENLKPTQLQLSALYQERLLPTLPGFKRLNEMSAAPVNTSCAAVGLMTQFLAKDVPNNRVLTADLGGSNAALFYADDKSFISAIRGGFGLSFGISNVLAETSCDNLRRWLPFEIGDDELIHYALNKVLRPQILPATDKELLIEGAFGREALLKLNSQLQGHVSSGQLAANRILGAGGPLVNIGSWQAALMLLDGLQPLGSADTGLVELELDSTMLLAATGTLATLNPNAAAYVFRYDCLHRLGPVIVPVGEGHLGTPAVTVTMTTQAGRVKQARVPYGSIALLPLRSDEKASLEIKPEGGFRIGQAARNLVVRTSPGQEMRGGALGLIIDARGRPLRFADDLAQRREQVASWHNVHRLALQQSETEESIILSNSFANAPTNFASDGGPNLKPATDSKVAAGKPKSGGFKLGRKK